MTVRMRLIQNTPVEAAQRPMDVLFGVAEAIPVPVVLLTPDMRIRHANATFVQILDIGNEHYLHKKFPRRWLVSPQDGLGQFQELLHGAVQLGVDREPVYLSLRSPGGLEIPTEIHARPVSGLDQGQDSLIAVTFKIAESHGTQPQVGWPKQDAHETPGQEDVDSVEGACRIFFEYAPDGHCLYDLDGRLIDCNKAAERILGYKREDLIGRNLRQLNILPDSQLPQAMEGFIQIAVGKSSGPTEYTLIHKNGSEIPVEVNACPVKIQNRIFALVRVRDITERKRAEEELRQSEQRFAIMADSAQDAIMMMDPRGRITFYNKTAQAIFGWTAAEVLGEDLHTFLAPQQHHEAYHKGLAHFQDTGHGPAIGRTLELTALRKNGTEFPIEISLASVQLGNEWHAIGIVRDVTDRKQAEEAILREKAFFDSVVNFLPGVFYMFDETGRLAWWNKNLEEVSEYSAAEILTVHPVQMFAPADRERVAERIAGVFAEGTGAVEANVVSKSGRVIPYFMTGVRVERNGKPYLLGYGIDVTERRQAQLIQEQLNAELEASVHELGRSNRELRDFAHITAHDLKAPLRGIGTLAEWLDRDCGGQIAPEGRENLRLLRQRVGRMERLINGILRYSEIGHGDRPVEVLDTHAIVKEAVEQIAAPDHIKIHIADTLPSVRAERTRLTQVFQNLIGNAAKYIDKPQGEIHISAGETADGWEFRIVDNGPGIEAKHFNRIFKMFQSLSPSDQNDSTGLGLAVVKKVVELYGGKVWVESELGHGSAFCFTIPKHESPAAANRGVTKTPVPRWLEPLNE